MCSGRAADRGASDELRCRCQAIVPILLLAAMGLALAVLSPAVVNGDGVGYLRRVDHGGLAPGHVGYLPLLRLVTRISAPDGSLADLERPARLASIAAGLGGLGFFFAAARRIHDRERALAATALLGVSHAFFRSAHEIEVYATALLGTMICLWATLRIAGTVENGARAPVAEPARAPRPARRAATWAALAGAACGAAALFHLTLALLGPGTVLLAARFAPRGHRARCAIVAAVALVLALGTPLALALHAEGATSATAAWRWLRSADHGLPYQNLALAPLAALWGLARSLIHVPYPYEAGWLRVGAMTALAAGAWGAVAWLRRGGAGARARELGRWLLLAWVPPLALFALFFYPSDTERWVFVLPVLLMAHAPAGGRRAIALVVAVGLANLLSSELPAARDREPLRRAAAVDRALRPTDCMISPGNGWDELVGFAARTPARRFVLIYFVGAERSLARGLERMHGEIARCFAAGGRVYVARLRDDGDQRGFKELAWFGLRADGLARELARYHPRPTPIDGLWQLTGARQ